MDSHAARNGKVIEELGWYHPIDPEDKQVLYDKDKVHAWIEKGAIVSPTVKGLLKRA
jgi:small subunit ribosomal protein S16